MQNEGAAVTTSLILDLPLPPSVNAMIRKLGNKSPVVQKWIKLADPYMLACTKKSVRKINGPFLIQIFWPACQFGKFDCDNRVKVLMDYLQRIIAFDNDRDCWRLTAEFSPHVPKYWCRVEITSRGW